MWLNRDHSKGRQVELELSSQKQRDLFSANPERWQSEQAWPQIAVGTVNISCTHSCESIDFTTHNRERNLSNEMDIVTTLLLVSTVNCKTNCLPGGYDTFRDRPGGSVLFSRDRVYGVLLFFGE